MFFAHKIKNIKNYEKVLEIGPGSSPHPRADAFLDLKYNTDQEKFAQFGAKQNGIYNKPLFYYDGKKFPFKDKEFDYVICSHVLEHVDDVPDFITELTRVAKKGYLEYPSPYYEYLFNFSVHKNILYFNSNEQIIYWMEKGPEFDFFTKCTDFFRHAFENGYTEFIDNNKNIFFHGFEWNSKIQLKKIKHLSEINFENIKLKKYKPNLLLRIINISKRLIKLND